MARKPGPTPVEATAFGPDALLGDSRFKDGGTYDVNLAHVTASPSVQIRDKLTVARVVERYEEALDNLPPIVVFIDPADTPEDDEGTAMPRRFILADGFNRVQAARNKKRNSFPAIVKLGTEDDARLYSATANATSGEPLTADERNAAIRRVAGTGATQQEVAAALSVSQSLVSRVVQIDKVKAQRKGFADLADSTVQEALGIRPAGLRAALLTGAAEATTDGKVKPWTPSEMRLAANLARSMVADAKAEGTTLDVDGAAQDIVARVAVVRHGEPDPEKAPVFALSDALDDIYELDLEEVTAGLTEDEAMVALHHASTTLMELAEKYEQDAAAVKAATARLQASEAEAQADEAGDEAEGEGDDEEGDDE